MLTIVIPTLNAEHGLTRTLTALVPGVVSGLVRRVVIADGGSTDGTLGIADEAGADIIKCERGRGQQMAAGAAAAQSEWLLFLHADTVLSPGWEIEAASFIDRVDSGRRPVGAAAFKFALDDFGTGPRLVERFVAFRCMVFATPYGDQGLLIPRRLYREVGGYKSMPLMEDINLISRLKRSQLTMLRTEALTSAVRYKRDGYVVRCVRNFGCLVAYHLRVPSRYIVRLYG